MRPDPFWTLEACKVFVRCSGGILHLAPELREEWGPWSLHHEGLFEVLGKGTSRREGVYGFAGKGI